MGLGKGSGQSNFLGRQADKQTSSGTVHSRAEQGRWWLVRRGSWVTGVLISRTRTVRHRREEQFKGRTLVQGIGGGGGG